MSENKNELVTLPFTAIFGTIFGVSMMYWFQKKDENLVKQK
jgi:hypothetical protein